MRDPSARPVGPVGPVGPARPGPAGWLAWALCALCLAVAAGACVFGAMHYRSLGGFVTGVGWNVILAVSFPVVGALVAANRPRNPIGWLMLTVGVSEGLVGLAWEYAIHAYRAAPGGALAGVAAWVNLWAWAPGAVCLLTFVPLLFPDGHPPSPRWRPVAWLAALPLVLICGVTAPLLWPLRGPALLDASGPPPGSMPALATVAFSASQALIPVAALLCLAGLLWRFRRSRGVERQQLKWLLYASTLTIGGAILFRPGSGDQRNLALLLGAPLFAAIPVAAGIAILRHRLYDIDRIVNRTIVYGLLSAVLGLGYAAVSLGIGQLARGSSLAVAAATLTVAALFRPLRSRIQGAVNRRFNRRRYDAARTIDAFRDRLRDHVELDSLAGELLAVAGRAMEPTSASLWLAPERRPPVTRG